MEDLISEVASVLKSSRICIVCEETVAKYYIKGLIKNCYCRECANQQFSHLDLLEKL